MKRNCKNKNIQREKKDKKKQKLVNVELSFFTFFLFVVVVVFQTFNRIFDVELGCGRKYCRVFISGP